MKEEKHVPVYINKPIDNAENDFLGFETYSDHLMEALEKSSTIGIIADYGTGKSSLIEYFKKRCGNAYDVVSINLWSVRNKTIDNDGNDNLYLHSHFLHQLAMQVFSDKEYAKSINRRMNKNYGLLSLNLPVLSKVCLVGISIFYFLYALTKETTTPWIESVLNGDPAGLFLGGVIVLGLYLLITGDITISSGKNESKRELNRYDIVEIYKDIIGKRMRYNPLVIIIEDLDRSTEREKVYNFLKELNSYYIDSLDSGQRNDVKFIINIKPESEIYFDEFEQQKNTEAETKMTPTLEMKKAIYSKVFDYTIDLFPINISNYDVILDGLLNEEKDELGKIGIHVEPEGNAKNPGMRRLIFGKDLTIRDIKERLNTAILLYHSLTEKANDKSVIDFSKCTFVAYLKNSYPVAFLELYKENKLEKVIKEYAISENPSEDALDAIIENTFQDADEYFVADLKEGIENKYIDMDYRMYFYNYPKNSYIRDINESLVYDTIIYNQPYSEEFDDALTEAIGVNPNIIGDTYAERKELTKTLPKVTYQNAELLNYSLMNNRVDTITQLDKMLDFEGRNFSSCYSFLAKVLALSPQTRMLLTKEEDFIQLILKKVQNITDDLLISIRRLLFSNYHEDINHFSVLYDKPFVAISEDEIELISNLSISLPLCTNNNLDLNAIRAIDKQLYSGVEKEAKKIDLLVNIYDSAAERIKAAEFAPFCVNFVKITKAFTKPIDEALVKYVQNDTVEVQTYTSLLNLTQGKGVSDQIVDNLKLLGIKSGLDIITADRLLHEKDNYLFVCNILKHKLTFEELKKYKTVILSQINQIYTNLGAKGVGYLRYSLLREMGTRGSELKSFSAAFKSPFPIITEEELSQVRSLECAFELIDANQVNETNVKYISAYINNKGPKSAALVNKLLELITSLKNEIIKPFFYSLDFDQIAYSIVKPDKRVIFLRDIEDALEITSNKNAIIRCLKNLRYLEKELERRLIGKFENNEVDNYVSLLNESNIDEFDEVTKAVIENCGYYLSVNSKVQEKLYQFGLFRHYVYSKTITEKKFSFEDDKLDNLRNAYLNLIKNSNLSSIHKLMFENETFVKFALEEEAFSFVEDNTLLRFAKVPQNSKLIDFIFTKDTAFIIKYFKKIVCFEDSATQIYFVDKILNREEILETRELLKPLKQALTDESTKERYTNGRQKYLNRKRYAQRKK